MIRKYDFQRGFKMGLEIDEIFDKFSSRTIFKDKQVLQSNYSPEVIHHRKDEINQIANILAPALRLERPSNLFIYGKTGTGKTLSVKYVESELLKRAKKQNIDLSILYVNCKLQRVADTEYRIMAELLRKLGEKVHATGLPTEQLYKRFMEIIDRKKQMIIVILDEIDQAIKKISDEFLYNLTRMNPELTKSQISIIGISNDLLFLDNLDARVKSSLSEEEIVFQPYDAPQLKDILKDRSKRSFKPGTIQEEVIGKCAAYAAMSHGDARRALDLLRVAGELAEREDKKKITEEYIDKANEKIEKDKILDVVEKSPKHFQIVLQSIISLTEKNKGKPLFTSDVYEIYKSICLKNRLEVLTQRRVGDIIGELDLQGIISFKVISRGRHGRTREIYISLSQQLLDKVKNSLLESLKL